MRTKKINTSVIVLFALCFFAGVAANVLAQTDETVQTPSSNRPETRVEKRAQAGGRILESQSRVRITNLVANVSNRFDATIARLENIIVRIESRIALQESEGVSLENAKTEVGNAKSALEKAKASMHSIDTAVSQMVSSEDPRSNWTDIKTTLTTTHTELRSAKEHLKQALGYMGNTATLPPETTVREINQSVGTTTAE